jgi:Flp pilus assembly protein TadG
MGDLSTGRGCETGRFGVRRSSLRFARDEDGSTTVEFVLWVPVFLAFMLLVADVSLAFMRQASLLDVSREAAQFVARHALDAPAAEDLAADRAQIGDNSPEVHVDIDAKAQTVTVTILVEMEDLAPFGILQSLHTGPIAIASVQAIEPI